MCSGTRNYEEKLNPGRQGHRLALDEDPAHIRTMAQRRQYAKSTYLLSSVSCVIAHGRKRKGDVTLGAEQI